MARSSADDEVDTIVSQAIDLAALEQITAPNSSSSLPINLQARFHKLKSSSMKKPSPVMINEPPPPPPPPPPHGQIAPPKEPRGPSSSPPSPIITNPFTYKRSPSPPQPTCCLCFGRSKGKGRSRKWGTNDEEEILTDFSTFSFKEQQRKLNKALKEEEKACKEAAKVADWVKQASARMDVSAIEKELLSEDELK